MSCKRHGLFLLTMTKDEKQTLELSNLDISHLGLVRRGANQRPFYILKSLEGATDMADKKDIKEVLAELETAETMTADLKTSLNEVFTAMQERLTANETPEPNTEDFAGLSPEDKSAVAAFLKRMGGKLGGQATAILQRMAGGAPSDTEKSNDDDTDDFAEQMTTMRTEMEEQFSAKLADANDRTKKAQEEFAAERRLRRLAEYTEHAQGYENLAVEAEQFGEDLMALADHDSELYTRLTKVLKAADETIKQGAIFEQFSVADRGDASGDPFLRKVEQLRTENFNTEAYEVGFTKAMKMAEMTEPDLARRYELETRLTDNG